MARIEGQLGNTSDQLADLLAFMKLQKETKETPETPKVPVPETGVGPKPATGSQGSQNRPRPQTTMVTGRKAWHS
jgi:hypothetical protein